MAISQQLLEILRCPNCRSEVELSKDEKTIKCLGPDCGLIYPVKDEIPVMIIEEAAKPSKGTKTK